MAIVYVSRIRNFYDGMCTKEEIKVFGDLGKAESYQKNHKIDILRTQPNTYWSADEPNMIRTGEYETTQYDIEENEVL